MKLFISADIEGVSDIVHWNETFKNHEDHEEFKLQLTREVKAACEGAIESGIKEILVKDAHESGRNIVHRELPKEVILSNGWFYHPFLMMEGLDKTFDGSIFIGYHCGASTGGSPLAHTMDPDKIAYIKINNQLASEFKINYYTALYLKVPVLLVVGDKKLIEEVNSTNNKIKTIITKEGFGEGAINIHPEVIEEKIYEETKEIIKNFSKEKYMGTLPESFKVEICYKNHKDSYKSSFYPGMKLKDNHTIEFESNDYMEVLKAFLFLT